jgi:cellulose synthase/poly-beta-1,6-N-acetylglucosamine synthase-like glycosyltransferase
MESFPKFSIVIPVKEVNDYVRETVPYIQSLDLNDWELIIVPNNADQNEWEDDKRVSLIPSGRVGPADKRDQAANFAKGEILVFLDDDSYPQSDLLSIATKYFDNDSISAIGGPAITPESDSYWQKVSGAVFLSKLTGGNPERYTPIGRAKEVDDWPSVNFMVRKSDFLEVGGFDSPYWPGEDTHLCLKLVQKTKKIVYAPELIVWHHRRSGLLLHMKQVGAYGLHRGYFARRLPETSLKAKYFAPSAILCLITASMFSTLLPDLLRNSIFVGLVVYLIGLIAGSISVARLTTTRIALGAVPFIALTHISYGFRFLQGFFKNGLLVSKLR